MLRSITDRTSVRPEVEARTIDESTDENRADRRDSCAAFRYGESDKTVQPTIKAISRRKSRHNAILKRFELQRLWALRYCVCTWDARESGTLALNGTWRAWQVVRGGKMRPPGVGCGHRSFR